MPAKISFSDKQLTEAIKRYEHGESMQDIAAWLGCAKNTVRQRFIERGVQFDRSRSLSRKLKGRVSSRKGAILSAETRRKISAGSKGHKRNVGRKLSEASKRKMREAKLKFIAENPDAMAILSAAASDANRLPPEERKARDYTRQLCKRFVRRLVTMPRTSPARRSEAMLGYTKQELREHIESQFVGDMSWENRGSFHVDHIVPIAVFLDHGIKDPAIINSLDNLQVLSPNRNQTKSSAFDPNGPQGELFRRLTGIESAKD